MTTGHSSARQRLLETARELFYHEGIRAIGVDTIVERSGVGKATLYRHFPTKDDLIAAYIEEEDRAHLQWFDDVTGSERPPKELLLAWLDDCEQRIQEPGFRGCPFLNAMAEIADTEHPAYQSAARHERALRDRLAQLCRQAGARDPEQLADQLLLVVNGALASAPLFGEASPAHQLTTIAAHLIDLQLERAENTSHRFVKEGEHG